MTFEFGVLRILVPPFLFRKILLFLDNNHFDKTQTWKLKCFIILRSKEVKTFSSYFIPKVKSALNQWSLLSFSLSYFIQIFQQCRQGILVKQFFFLILNKISSKWKWEVFLFCYERMERFLSHQIQRKISFVHCFSRFYV